MENVYNHNREVFSLALDEREYWDFHLALDRGVSAPDGLQTECLAAYIDLTDEECIDGDSLYSKSDYTYDSAVNTGLTLSNIGFTGVDNGLITFDKDTITEDEFNELYTSSELTFDEDDLRLRLTKVSGNNQKYCYGASADSESGCASLSGGFYQGIFRSGDGCSYQVLPSTLGEGWTLEFVMKPSSEVASCEDGTTLLNDTTGKGGTFFYIGTRAENKWARYYNSDGEETSEVEDPDGTVLSDRVKVIESDNKYLIFDRTDDGKLVRTYEDGDTARIVMDNGTEQENFFPIFNRTDSGYMAKTYSEYKDSHRKEYDSYADLYRNALALRVGEDGSVGYLYLVRDCESEEPAYKIESLFSTPGLVSDDEWCVITAKILPLPYTAKDTYATAGYMKLMRILIYVNGVLKVVSPDLPALNLRMLDETADKQEGVAYNISLGGGTQGLCDAIYEDYTEDNTDLATLATEFGGTFMGCIRSFKFHSCPLGYNNIVKSAKYELSRVDV